MPIDPNSVKWDASPQIKESDIKWDDDATSPGKGFKSGEAFKDTKALIPSMDDIEKAWDKFKQEMKDNKSLSELHELAQKSPEAKAAIEAKMKADVSNARGLGNSIYDNALALPAMLAGGVAGGIKGATSLDASKGLHTGEEVMHSLLPSTMMGNEDAQKTAGYTAGMAPVTATMDALNAVPQGYGEMVNAAGYPAAAQQVTDAGKLGIMVGAGYHGAKGMVEGVRGKKDTSGHADKIDPGKVKWDDTPPNQHSAADRGVPGQQPGAQGELFSPERPTAPIDEAGQGDLFNGMPPKFGESTVAHADDYAAVNPYDAGGHVSASDQGHPTTLDNPQGELFGGRSLEQPPTSPIGDLASRDLPSGGPNSWERGEVGSRDAARAKREQTAREEEHRQQQEAEHKRLKEEAFKSMEALANQSKERDLNHMEAQGQLDFADSVSRVEESQGRNFFTDPNNREKAVRPEDREVSTAREFSTDPANRDKLDLQEANPFIHRATDEHLERLYNDTFRQWVDGGRKDAGLEKLMDTLRDERVQRGANKLKEDNKDRVNEIHPGYTHIPDGTIVEYEYKGEIHRGPVEKSTTIKTAVSGTTHVPRVRTPEGRLIPLDADQIKRVYGKPKAIDYHSDHGFAGEGLGDKTLMHPEATESMVDALLRGDVKGVLDIIAKNHENVAYRNLADYLKDKLEGLNIRMHDEGIITMGDRHATGYYDPATHTVGLSRVGAVSPHTVLHELVHAMTSDFVNQRPNDLRVLGLKDLFNKLSEMGMEKEFPGIVNVKEFLAEAFSNPEFQQFLKDHRVAERSTWRRFVDNVKSILGFSSATRNHITDALEHTMDLGKQIAEAGKDGDRSVLKDAGVPSKLADLMVTRNKRPEHINTRNSEDVQRLKVPGLTDPISDFKFYDKPVQEIIKMAREAVDIPNTLLEKLSHQLQGGGLFESLKTRNPVVKFTYERITRAMQEATHDIKTYLTDPETGLKAYMRAMTPDEKGEIHHAMILAEGQRILSVQELRQRNFNEKQIAYYQKQRALDDQFFTKINERRKELGMTPMDKRVAHMAGRFMGDFSRFVFNKDGKIVGRIAGSTKWELNKVSKHMRDNHPDWTLGTQEYNTLGKGKNPADRFSGLMEAINFITKTDADAAKLFDSYQSYMQKDAINYLNATRHAKAKVKDAGGIVGSEGNKPWLDAVKNAEQGMKAQLAYFEQGYQWMAMEKAVNELKPLLGDEEVFKQTPNAQEWGKKYVDHALGRNQGPLADAANWTASKLGELSGVGHSNMFKATNTVKHLAMQKFMGLLNIPFSITQFMQPFQVHPPMMALLKSRGLEFSAMEAQMKAVQTYFHALTNEAHGKLSAFDKQAMDFADKMGIVDVKMADHTKDINESKFKENYNKIADLNIVIPERLTRGTSFLFYSHLLKDAGVPMKDIFGAAENLTNMVMVNYHPIERPMGYAKLGWLGDLASTLTRYKHNQASQMAFYTREGIHNGTAKSYAPMATFLATSIAFGGALGFFGFQEADAAYQLVTEYLGKPDTLTNVVLSSGMPEVLTHGVFSTIGLDMTTRFSNANFVPNSIPEALVPFGSMALDVVKSTARLASDPTSVTKWKQFGKSVAPQSSQGILENTLFTEKRKEGTYPKDEQPYLYQNSTDGPNLGKGRVDRSEGDMALRNLGFRSIRESKKLGKSYSDGQIEKANENIVKGLVTKVQYDIMDGRITDAKLAAYAQRAATYGETPDSFIGKVAAWEGARHMSQAEQIRFRNAISGFKGAMNIKEGR